MELKFILESILFSSQEPLNAKEIRDILVRAAEQSEEAKAFKKVKVDDVITCLEQLAAEIDSRGLEGWEAAPSVAQPLALLYRCLEKLDTAPELKQKIYDRICRLDPSQALACGR